MSSDNFGVNFIAAIIRRAPIHKTVSFMTLRSIDVETLKQDIKDSTILHPFNRLQSLIHIHTPLFKKGVVLRPSYQLHSNQIHEPKHPRRKLERKWRCSKMVVNHHIYGASIQPYDIRIDLQTRPLQISDNVPDVPSAISEVLANFEPVRSEEVRSAINCRCSPQTFESAHRRFHLKRDGITESKK